MEIRSDYCFNGCPANRDLILELPEYYLAFEIKMTERVTKSGAKNLHDLEEILDKPLKRSYILSNDRETKYFDEKTVALNAAMFLG